jgi:hypothetical protein
MAFKVNLISFLAKDCGKRLGDVAADNARSPIRSHDHVFSDRPGD